ncbi:MAG: COG4315 family predicted lipoprotein [Mycobacteriales bacterium]|nr:MAG: hypothetical protein DLM56_07355 [Pseudonocardiales bacterium]
MKTSPHRLAIGATTAAIAVLAAACGNGSSAGGSGPGTPASSTGPSTATTATSGTSGSTGTGGATVITRRGGLGTYLTDSAGRTVYEFEADSNGRSACSGACVSVWQPLTTKTKPTASRGATAADVATITRSDGSKQVTYKGHPLYYYSGDTAAGQTTGQGNDGFGAKWYVLAPSGAPITHGAAATQSSSGGYGGY